MYYMNVRYVCIQEQPNSFTHLVFRHPVSLRYNMKPNFRDSRSAKSAILTQSEALNFEFWEFLHFLQAEIHQINKIQGPEIAKTAVLEVLKSQKLISRKIWVTEKFWNFHTVLSRDSLHLKHCIT